MDVDDLVVLFDYMYWVNRRLLERAGQLSPEGFAAPHGDDSRAADDARPRAGRGVELALEPARPGQR